jgi:hypothetical protein
MGRGGVVMSLHCGVRELERRIRNPLVERVGERVPAGDAGVSRWHSSICAPSDPLGVSVWYRDSVSGQA